MDHNFASLDAFLLAAPQHARKAPMKRLATLAALALIAAVGTAQADKPKPPKPTPPKPPKPAVCVPDSDGFKASGTLIKAALTAEGHGRYSGTIEVNVAKANHHAPTGDQTYTLTHARVKFHHGVSSTEPAPGSRVKLSGKISELPNKHCATGFTPTITVKKVDIKRAKK
jgi:hypothetical protein